MIGWPRSRRFLLAGPLLAAALITHGPSRDEVITLARKKFPAIMSRREPARFLVMVFDSTEKYLWGFPAKGSVMFNIGADTITSADRRAMQTDGRAGRASADGTRHSYGLGVPSLVRDSTRALRQMPMNVDEWLVPIAPGSEQSGIEGLLARDVVYVDRIAVYPREDAPLQFDIFAVHLNSVRPDTGRPVHSEISSPPMPVHRDTAPTPAHKKASVKRLIVLPLPLPPTVASYELVACFDVAPNGDGKLLSWTRSLDLNYNSRVKKTLDQYRFSPATDNGVPVRETLCVRAKATASGR